MWESIVALVLLAINNICFALRYPVLSVELKILGVLLLITLVGEVYATYLMSQHIRNLHVYHGLTILQYCFYSLIYYYAIRSKRIRSIILFSIPLFLVVVGVISFSIQTLQDYNSYAVVIKTVLLSSWILLYFEEQFQRLTILSIEREPLFWISTGLLFFSAGDFFAEGLMNYLLTLSRTLAKRVYYIYLFLTYFLYILFIIAFLCKGLPNKTDKTVQ